jgi:hypothetical protein
VPELIIVIIPRHQIHRQAQVREKTIREALQVNISAKDPLFVQIGNIH